MNNYLQSECLSLYKQFEKQLPTIKQLAQFQIIIQSIRPKLWVVFAVVIIIIILCTVFIAKKYLKGPEKKNDKEYDFQQDQNQQSGTNDNKNKSSKQSQNPIWFNKNPENELLLEESNSQSKDNVQNEQQGELQKPSQEKSHSVIEIRNQKQVPPQQQLSQKQFEQHPQDFDLINQVQNPIVINKPQEDQSYSTDLTIHQGQSSQIQNDEQQEKKQDINQSIKVSMNKYTQQDENKQKSNQVPQENQNIETDSQQSPEFQDQIFTQHIQYEEIIEGSQEDFMIQESTGLQQINYAYKILDERFYTPSFKSRQIDDEELKKFVRDYKNVQGFKDEYNLDNSQEKILNNQIQHFIPIRGDGNCLFTSLGYLYVYYNLIDDKRFERLVEVVKSTDFIQICKSQENNILFEIQTQEEQSILRQEFLEWITKLRNIKDHQELLQQIAKSINNYYGPFYGLLIIFMRNYFRKISQDFYDTSEENFLIQNPDQIIEFVTWEFMYDETDIALKLFAAKEQILIICFQKMNVDDQTVQISEYKDDNQKEFKYKIGLAFQPGHFNAIKLHD